MTGSSADLAHRAAGWDDPRMRRGTLVVGTLGLVFAAAACDGGSTRDDVPGLARLSAASLAVPVPAAAAVAALPRPARTSPLATVTRLISDQPASLPFTTTFPSAGGKLVVTVSGAAHRRPGTPAERAAAEVLVDGEPIGALPGALHAHGDHDVHPAATFVVDGVRSGDHTVTIRGGEGTVTSPRDAFTVTVAELR